MAIRPATPGGTSTGGNPFGGGGGATASTTSLVQQFRVQLPNGSIVTVNSQAEVDALKANYQQPTVISTSGGSSSGGGLRTAADVAETVGAFLAGRNLRNKVADADDARARLNTAVNTISNLRTSPSTSYADLVPALVAAFDAQRDLDDAQTDALDAQITAVDIAAGAGAVRVVSQFANGDMAGMSGNTALLAAGGLGVGLLLTGNNNNSSRSRR